MINLFRRMFWLSPFSFELLLFPDTLEWVLVCFLVDELSVSGVAFDPMSILGVVGL